MRDDIRGLPGHKIVSDAAVPDGNDDIGALGDRRVNRLLDGAVQRLSGVVFAETVDVIAGIVLKVFRRGRRECLWCRDTHVSNLMFP
jgi:hypothetical protein